MSDTDCRAWQITGKNAKSPPSSVLLVKVKYVMGIINLTQCTV